MYRKYHFFLTKNGNNHKLLLYTIQTKIKKYCKKGFSVQ
ncbi:hypothetical protein [Tenacibaculum vairaonense]